MAMEKFYSKREAHTRSITALGYNATRREIVIGCEDGCVKSWEAGTGRLLQTSLEHTGCVTDILYWHEQKLMLSSSNDGCILVWGTAGSVIDKIPIGMPVYCMVINPRRQQLVCGVSGGIKIYALDEEKECGSVINKTELHFANYHHDVVRNILCADSRIFSAGYDHKLIIYDSSYTGSNILQPLYINHQAHEAGICCMISAKDNENNSWVMTGSFDKTMKIWSADGKLIHKLDNFLDTITGICYVPRNKTVWIAGGTSYASQYDPKSGDNVSDFIGTFQNQEDEQYVLQLLRYFPEINQVVASTNRRHLMVWRYNSGGCITTLKCKTAMESLCYTTKIPILIFTGDTEGTIVKWERMQSNHFMYSKEMFPLSDSCARTGSRSVDRTTAVEDQNVLNAKTFVKKSRTPTSHYSFNKPVIPPISQHNHSMTAILRILFVERLDYIIAASEDSNIYIWGFDENAVAVLRGMKPHDLDSLIQRFGCLLQPTSELLPTNAPQETESDSVTNRVAGFICKYVFVGHFSCVTSLVAIGPEHGMNATYLLSGGWDRRIYLWNLDKGDLQDTYRHSSEVSEFSVSSNDVVSDGVILDMDYCPDRVEFAHASSDRMVYIRRFSTVGSKMVLLNTLQGHEGEVTSVRWNNISKKWITGSEDSTIRIWSSEGMNECEMVLSTHGGVLCMCIDMDHGGIVAGVQNDIKVYEPETYRLVQTNMGHTESVKCIIHVPERNQYVSCSGDKTVRVWNCWKLSNRMKKITKKEDKKTKKVINFPTFEDILNEIKLEASKQVCEKTDSLHELGTVVNDPEVFMN